MHIHIDTTDDAERERTILLIRYWLHGHRTDIDSVQLSVAAVRDALGTRLSRCRLRTVLRRGQTIEVEEVQSSFDLAVNRALERGIRTIQRRLGITTRRYIG